MKRFYLIALLFAGAMSSCSKNEVTEILPSNDNINRIGMDLASKTSRGVETTTASINANAINIPLAYFSATAEAAGALESDGAIIDFSYNVTDKMWYAATETTWGDISFPAHFYSLHSGDATSTVGTSLPTTIDADKAVYGGYTVDAAAALEDHKDLIYYHKEYASIPPRGTITGAYKHALSRVEMYSSSDGYHPYVQSITFANVNSVSASATVNSDMTIEWATPATPATYTYLNKVVPTIETYADDQAAVDAIGYTYFKPIDAQILSDESVEAVTNNYLQCDANNMILMPQALANGKAALTTDLDAAVNATPDPVVSETVTCDYVKANAAYTKIDVPYVQVLYRMRDKANTTSVVGYEKALDYYKLELDDAKLAAIPADAKDAIYPEGAVGDYTRLYVLVGFPFAEDDLSFKAGYDYDLNLGLNETGGYLLYDYFFTIDGNPTNIPVKGFKPGDPILPSEDTQLSLKLTVDEWIDGGDINM